MARGRLPTAPLIACGLARVPPRRRRLSGSSRAMVRRVAALAAAGVAVAAGVASASAQSYGCSYGAYGNYGYGIDGLWSDFCEPPAPPAQIESPVPAPQQQPLAPPQPVASPPAEGQGYEYSHGYGYAPPMSAEPPAPDTCVCDPDTLLSLVLQADGTFPGNAGGTISSGNADDVKEMVEVRGLVQADRSGEEGRVDAPCLAAGAAVERAVPGGRSSCRARGAGRQAQGIFADEKFRRLRG